jgi:DNA-binding PadR family transcriptional regulator
MSRERLTPSSFVILGLLSWNPSSGYELGSWALRSVSHFWPLTRTHIYGELAKLESLGMVTSSEVEQRGAPDKRVYTVTEEGLRVLDDWVNDPDPGLSRPRHPMLVKLFFAERADPARVRELIARYRAEVLARRSRFQALASQPHTSPRFAFTQMTAAFGLRRMEADLAWLDDVEAALAESE